MTNDEINKLNFDKWPLPDECLLELGRVASLWVGLEFVLNICIGKLAGFDDINDPKPFILVTHSSFPQRLDMLSALCEALVRERQNLADYKTVVQNLRQAQTLRNTFMHNGLHLNPESGHFEMAKGTARGTLKVGVDKVTIADIRRASMAIHEAEIALYKLVLDAEIRPVWTRH